MTQAEADAQDEAVAIAEKFCPTRPIPIWLIEALVAAAHRAVEDYLWDL